MYYHVLLQIKGHMSIQSTSFKKQSICTNCTISVFTWPLFQRVFLAEKLSLRSGSNSFQIKWFSSQTPRKDEYSLLNFYLSELKTNARASFLTTKDHFGPADTDRSIRFLIDDYWPANRSIFHQLLYTIFTHFDKKELQMRVT